MPGLKQSLNKYLLNEHPANFPMPLPGVTNPKAIWIERKGQEEQGFLVRNSPVAAEFLLTSSFFFFSFIIDLRERERGRGGGRERKKIIDLLFHLLMHSFVGSWMCPDRGSNLQPWRGWTML